MRCQAFKLKIVFHFHGEIYVETIPAYVLFLTDFESKSSPKYCATSMDCVHKSIVYRK